MSARGTALRKEAEALAAEAAFLREDADELDRQVDALDALADAVDQSAKIDPNQDERWAELTAAQRDRRQIAFDLRGGVR